MLTLLWYCDTVILGINSGSGLNYFMQRGWRRTTESDQLFLVNRSQENKCWAKTQFQVEKLRIQGVGPYVIQPLGTTPTPRINRI